MTKTSKQNSQLSQLLKKRWFKITAVILTIIIILYSVLSYYIDSKIAQKIMETEDVSCGQINFNLLLGNLELNNIEAVQPLKNTDQILIKSSKINIRGLSYWQYLRHNKVVANKVSFESLDVNVVNAEKGENPLPKEAVNREQKYSEVLIKTFEIKKGKLKTNNDRFEEVRLDSFSTRITQLQYFPNVDTAQVDWNTITFKGYDFLINEKSKNHSVAFESVALEANENLNIINAKLVPKRSKKEFIEPLTYRKDRIDVTIPSTHISRFSVKELFTERKFITDKIVMNGFDIEVFSNYSKPRCPTCFRSYFYEYLGKTDLKIGIDTILVKKSKVAYELSKADNRENGRLFWTDVYTSVYDVTNIKANKKASTKVDIIAKFMDKGKTKVTFSFPNLDATQDYTFTGTLDTFNLNEMNSFLNASNRINIENGEVNQLTFSGRGNLESSSGNIELRYKDLSLRFFKSDNSTRKLLTNLANSLIKNSNTKNSENLRQGKMFYERDNQKLFIENWIGTLKSGLYSTLLPDIMLPDELTTD